MTHWSKKRKKDEPKGWIQCWHKCESDDNDYQWPIGRLGDTITNCPKKSRTISSKVTVTSSLYWSQRKKVIFFEIVVLDGDVEQLVEVMAMASPTFRYLVRAAAESWNMLAATTTRAKTKALVLLPITLCFWNFQVIKVSLGFILYRKRKKKKQLLPTNWDEILLPRCYLII